MRLAVAALAILLALPAVAAEIWQVREGECGDWRSRWDVEQDNDGVWKGMIDHIHVGGPCTPPTGARIRTRVQAIIAGENFFATRQDERGGVCSYYGRLRGDRVRGVGLCEGIPQRLVFALRFPPGETLEDRQRFRGRDRDEFLDDPRTYERGRPPPGFDLEFRIGPRRP
jgi:hypothetical protein